MTGHDNVVQWVTPLPPSQTGISQYSREMLELIDGAWPVIVYAEDGAGNNGWKRLRVHPASARSSYDPGLPAVFQLGNSGYHQFAFERALSDSGILVLHDVVVHHGRIGELLRGSSTRDYKRVMSKRYGAQGAKIVDLVLAGQAPENLNDYPLCEDYVERARLTIVHSEYARALVHRHVPGARVVQVPQGIALPALINQGDARRALGLPQSAFIIASITHVNPYKRIPVILRALRRLITMVPEAVFVIAGSIAPGIELERQIRSLRLEQHVIPLGYISDDQARLVARAADVCVNLRYPSFGETSASLLRLMGAARPVIVTESDANAEYPRDAVLPVPVDSLEDEMIADLLLMLAERDAVREAAGQAARRFIENEHTLAIALEGYRHAIAEAYGLHLPVIADVDLHEPPPQMNRLGSSPTIAFSSIDASVADALHALRLDAHDGTVRTAASAMVGLRLNRLVPDADAPAVERPSADPSLANGSARGQRSRFWRLRPALWKQERRSDSAQRR